MHRAPRPDVIPFRVSAHGKLNVEFKLLCGRCHTNRTKEYSAATREEALENWVKWGQGVTPLPGCEVDEQSEACIKEAGRFK